MTEDHAGHFHGAARKSVEEVRDFYNREAAGYRGGEVFKSLIGEKRLRRELLAKARGRILDVACGTGENFPYFTPGSDVTAIEFSPGMLAFARDRAQSVGLNAEFQIMDAQRLTFSDAAFDTVTSALSTCTFPDPIAALQEMKRVCKPGGQILLLEHGRSSVGVVARFQDRRARQFYEANACRWNQDSAQLVRDAGLTLKSVRRALAGIYFVMEAAP